MFDRRNRLVLLILTLFLVGLASTATVVGNPADRTIITIYQNGPSLVIKKEGVELDQGINKLTRTIPSSTLTETIFLDSPDGQVQSLRVVPPVDKESKLLNEFLGKKITVYKSEVDSNPVVGTLVDLIGGNPLLKRPDGSFRLIKNPNEYQFEGAPPELRDNKLKVEVSSDERVKSSLTLGYHLNGLSWSPQYVGFLDEEKQELRLRGVAHISNDTGWNFEQAKLCLLAGSPSREKEAGMKLYAARNASQQEPSQPESVFEYYRYPLDSRLNLPEGVDTRVKFMKKEAADYQRRYEFEPSVSSAVRSLIVLRNTEEEGLGLPLASGIVRIYDSTEERTFLGADSLPNLPQGDTARLDLGKTFDVKGDRTIRSHEKVDDKHWEDRVTIRITNRKDRAVEVKVIERLRGSWDIVQFSHDYEKIDANRVQFEVKVPADGSTEISYTVKYRY